MEEEEEDWLLEEDHGDRYASVSEEGEQTEMQEIQPMDEDRTGKSVTEASIYSSSQNRVKRICTRQPFWPKSTNTPQNIL